MSKSKTRAPKLHVLKTLQSLFVEVYAERKMFEIRVNDRDFRAGDFLALCEIVAAPQSTGYFYSGRVFVARVTYLTDFAQQSNHVVMSLKPHGLANFCALTTAADAPDGERQMKRRVDAVKGALHDELKLKSKSKSTSKKGGRKA